MDYCIICVMGPRKIFGPRAPQSLNPALMTRQQNWLVGAVFQAFAIFCGMGINNSRMYEQVVKAMARQSIALDILAYHTSASVEEVQRLKVCSY